MKVLSPTLDMQSSQIDNMADPTAAQDAATKTYADGKISNSAAGTITVTDAGTTNVPYPLTVVHNSSGTPAANFGTGILFTGKSDTVNNRTLVDIDAYWEDPADATRSSRFRIRTAASGSFVNNLFLYPTGGASFGVDASQAAGVVNANVGFRVANAALNFSHLAGSATVAQGGLGAIGTPSVGDILRCKVAGAYDHLGPNTLQATPANPTATTNTTGVMMGLAQSFTPNFSGRVLILVSGYLSNGTASAGAKTQIRHGTGTAPINGAALVGTADGNFVAIQNGTSPMAAIPFAMQVILTGLTIGTAYWIDLSLASLTSGTSTLFNPNFSIIEL